MWFQNSLRSKKKKKKENYIPNYIKKIRSLIFIESSQKGYYNMTEYLLGEFIAVEPLEFLKFY